MEKSETKTALSIKNLSVAYDQEPVLKEISLEIPKASLCAVIGPNGAGKTTLMKAVLGLIKPLSGEVCFPHLGVGEITKAMAYVPQTDTVDWDFPISVLDLVMMGRYAELGWIKRPGKRQRKEAKKALAKVGMETLHKRHISQLSGGQKQRIFLARALAQEAEIYFMDEPFKGVDIETEKAIMQVLHSLKEEGKTIIVVHHNLATVPEYFDWVCLINGNVIENGPTSEVFTEENLKITYGINQKEGA